MLWRGSVKGADETAVQGGRCEGGRGHYYGGGCLCEGDLRTLLCGI